MKKVSMSLPAAVVDDLDHISARLGISRSALTGQLLAAALPDMRALLDIIPPAPTPSDLVRFRGESADVVRARLDSLLRAQSDLLSGE